MFYLFLVPIGIAAAGLFYLALQPGEIRVRRSLLIERDRTEVFDEIRDLRNWHNWSPWLLHEPDACLSYADAPDQAGGWYAWSGKGVGAGRVTHLRLEAPERIEQRISFERPFKSTGALSWELAAHASGTEVFWVLRARLPFLFRFLAPTVSAAVGKDFELGLILLRARLDPTADQLRIRFIGDTDFPEQTSMTIPFQGPIDAMVEAMQQGFPRLAATAAERDVVPAGPPFTAYHVADPKRGHFECDLALPVPDGTTGGDLAMRRLGGGRYYMTEVQGAYDFLAPAWYSVMTHLRMVRRKWDRKRPSLEVYAVDPVAAAGSNDILTRLYVPIR